MDAIKLFLIIIIIMSISLAAVHFWVFICDTIIGGIKRVFGFKKKKINWHTIDNDTIKKQDDITTAEKVVQENETL